MSNGRLYLIFKLFLLIPETRCFGFKRWLLRLAGINVGRNVRVCSSVFIAGAGKLSIGDNTWIGHRVTIIASSKITIGSNVDIAPLVYIGTGTHQIDASGPHVAGKGISGDIEIGDGAWLGARSTILPGVKIADMSVVGAGAVVTKSTESKKIYAGVPAKFLKDV